MLQDLHARSIEVLMAQVKASVRDRLRKTGVMTELGEDRVYLSIGSAVTDFQRRWGPEAAAALEREAAPEAQAELGPEPASEPASDPDPDPPVT